MAGKANFQGELKITLNWQGNYAEAEVSNISIESTRPTRIASLFTGKKIQETVDLISSLFGICSTAQVCAALRAYENALNRYPVYEIDIIRQSLIDIEALRELLWRMFLDWPKQYGSEPNRTALTRVLQLQQQFEQAVGGKHCWLSPNADSSNIHKIDSNACYSAILSLEKLLEEYVLVNVNSEGLSLSDERKNLEQLEPSSCAYKLLTEIIEKIGKATTNHK